MRLDKRWWLLVGLVLLLALFFGFDLGRFLSLAAIKSSQADLQAWRAGQPLLAGLVFFTGYVAVAALSLPGAAVMTLAAGALFGLGWGTLIVSFASSIGATIAFLAARWLLGGWVQSRFGDRLAALQAGRTHPVLQARTGTLIGESLQPQRASVARDGPVVSTAKRTARSRFPDATP